MPKNNKRAPYISALCVTAAVALAACTSASSTTTPSAPPSTTVTTSAPQSTAPTAVTASGQPFTEPTVVSTSTPSPVSGQFTGLPDGSKVDWQPQISGTVRGLPPGTDAWIVVYPELAPAYWPQPGPLQLDSADGFRTSVYIGAGATQNIGEKFIVRLVITAPAASARFRAFLGPPPQSQGLSTLPPGVQTLATITVTRIEG
jgi:hypothetical protein